MKDYQLWALASAVFAGITAILAKKGVETVPEQPSRRRPRGGGLGVRGGYCDRHPPDCDRETRRASLDVLGTLWRRYWSVVALLL